MRQMLQNETAILLQNATEVYYKMHQVFYYKMRRFYCKIRQLLQNSAFITNCDSTANHVSFRVQQLDLLHLFLTSNLVK